MERKPASNYLEFSRKEKNGIVICMAIIIFLLWLPSIYEKLNPPVLPTKDELLDAYLQTDSAAEKKQHEYYRGNHYSNDQIGNDENRTNTSSLHLFPFDPNTLSDEGWRQIGLKEKTIKTILNYTSKGGKFRKPDDIKKIWGISEKQAEQLIPFVVINEKVTATSKDYHNSNSSQKNQFKTIDINTSDSATLEQLKGVGFGLARRIINYRERLGGFYSILQIGEVFGLPDSVFQKIKPQLMLSDKNIKKININKAQLDELKAHPYIRYKLANAIIQYRNQHGNFGHTEDLKKIILMDNESYNKIINYISL